jgi:serine/threonine protein kinase
MGNNFSMQGKDAYYFKNTIEDLIGSGGYSNVFRATRKLDNHLVAIKRSKEPLNFLSVDKQQGEKDEIKNMKAFPHPFIVKIIDEF